MTDAEDVEPRMRQLLEDRAAVDDNDLVSEHDDIDYLLNRLDATTEKLAEAERQRDLAFTGSVNVASRLAEAEAAVDAARELIRAPDRRIHPEHLRKALLKAVFDYDAASPTQDEK